MIVEPELPAHRPIVVVFRASPDEPPPGIEHAAAVAEIVYAPDPDALAERMADADALFFYRASKAPLEAAFSRASHLRWIHTASAGVDGLLFPALADSGVAITNARGVFDASIAEWVLGSMLAFATGIVTSLADQPHRRWNDDRTTERLAGKRLLVVGPGPIGRASAVLAAGAGMDVAAVGTRERDDDVFGRVAGPERLHDELSRADFVLDALPLTPQTRHRFDAAAFAAMKRTARFLNVGRGATVDQAALVDALHEGGLAGAALDVFEEEPLPATSPLWEMPNVIVSPHICGDFEGWERAVVDVFVRNLKRWVAGEPLANRVDPHRGHGI